MKVYQNQFESTKLLNANYNGPAFQLNEMYGFFFQIVVTGTPTGSFKLQCSGDPSLRDTMPTRWVDVASSTTAVSAAGSIYFNITDVFYNWVRLVYTDGSSGASTARMLAIFNAKGV